MRDSPSLKPSSAAHSNATFVDVDCPMVADSRVHPRSTSVAIALTLIRVYKLTLSPIFSGSCRFLPSCADYAAEAISTYGVGRGTWLSLRRLGRCHPFCQGGHDPVPSRD